MDYLQDNNNFDKRYFPDLTDEQKKLFIINTNRFERISVSEEEYHNSIIIPKQSSPPVAGQLRSLNLIVDLATNAHLLPNQEIETHEFDDKFSWFKRLHKNVLYNFAQKNKTNNQTLEYPQENDLGTYRTEAKYLNGIKMPDPHNINKLLTFAFNDYLKVYNRYHPLLENPRNMEMSDWRKLEKATYQISLDVCCIKPFADGSNRVARLAENLLRLNVGLKFKTYDKIEPLQDIVKHQKANYLRF
jgi:hypothetical protein